MTTLTATLVADGPSDRVLLPVISFLLDAYCDEPYRLQFAEGLHAGPLEQKVNRAIQLYPCELLLVHRDAETASVVDREHEIIEACRELHAGLHCIQIIPVRMTESWLLLDERAIYGAAGNPNGQALFALPAADQLESLPDPKAVLLGALIAAKDIGANRRRRFRPEQHRHRVSELIEDYSQLRALESFRHFERQIIEYLQPRN